MKQTEMKNVICPECGGRGYSTGDRKYGMTCNKCFGSGTIRREKDNFDLIRDMNDVQLARLLESAYEAGRISHKDTAPNYLAWLRQSKRPRTFVIGAANCDSDKSVPELRDRSCNSCRSCSEHGFCYKKLIFVPERNGCEKWSIAV